MKNPKKIYIIYSGGTIGMKSSVNGYVPEPKYLQQQMAKITELKSEEMPSYEVKEFPHLIDSSDATPNHWNALAQEIISHYHEYDGFVILHGTDTMAYTASALSFILENLAKPVLITGAQLPLEVIRSDARSNLIDSLLIASHFVIPEVCLYFNKKLFRGNRSKKVDANSFSAFASPNYIELGKMGAKFTLANKAILRPTKKPLATQLIEPSRIMSFSLFPGVSFKILEHIFRFPIQALVLETYGLGNVPSDAEFLSIIKTAVQLDIVVVNCSQCLRAKIDMETYSSGSILAKAGVISAGDMTREAVLAKLFYLLSKYTKTAQVKKYFNKNLRGELTIE